MAASLRPPDVGKKKHRGGLIPPTSTQHIQARMQQTTIRGPLPPPEILQQYEVILPGMAERLVKAFEAQGDHRRDMDDKALSMNFRLARVGQVFAFILGLAALGCGTYLIATGHNAQGIAVVFGTIGSMVTAFLWTGRSSNRRAQTGNAGEGS